MTAEEKDIRDRIIKEALSWKGTPYHDRAGIKHVGVDCAYYPCRVYQAVSLMPKDFVVPKYNPQQWLNSPLQVDKMHLRFEDTTFLDVVKTFAVEIPFEEILPGDLMLMQIIASWTHGAIIIDWPKVYHSVKGKGVIGSDGVKEGFWATAPKRYFSVVRKVQQGVALCP